jgi:hypothetical protein
MKVPEGPWGVALAVWWFWGYLGVAAVLARMRLKYQRNEIYQK